jgi:hypothetical protein
MRMGGPQRVRALTVIVVKKQVGNDLEAAQRFASTIADRDKYEGEPSVEDLDDAPIGPTWAFQWEDHKD